MFYVLINGRKASHGYASQQAAADAAKRGEIKRINERTPRWWRMNHVTIGESE